ncbi:MAG: hypothetical protein EOS41_05705 [Mesorhizobium sp.]|uniref:hypothetical protein n=1 Tax=Mesorhizobium sp. TaxID=1871066 RepID=UPI000FE9352E|nr:hypothetical protein [Mesorhizobium sp.]RWE26627.1 MAG: hypothetical protein EOS41_05705 [Mesorhizobium sp.]
MPNTLVRAAAGGMPTLQPFGMPKGMDPRTWRQALEKQINDLFDRAASLITALDCMEADCDLEDDGDEYSGDEHEPSLSWTLSFNQDRALAAGGGDVSSMASRMRATSPSLLMMAKR